MQDLDNYEFIRNFVNLESLAIFDCDNFNDLSIIEGMKNLEYLQVVMCPQISDIVPIIMLKNEQFEIRQRAIQENKSKGDEAEDPLRIYIGNKKLTNINLTDCNISSLEPFRDCKSREIDELHLSFNQIKDIEPLGTFSGAYISLSHNQIEHIESLFSSDTANYHAINLRHNLIKDISGIKIHPSMIPGKIKIRIKHNQIPPQQLEEWRKEDYIWLEDV